MHLRILNKVREDAMQIENKAQSMLNAWHQSLEHAGGQLKLQKLHWTMQEHAWRNNTASFITTQNHNV